MIPEFVRPFLWSYDINALDISRDKKRIITNVLNVGTKQATDWIFETYTKQEIQDCLKDPLPGEWNNKSIAFWSLILDVKPKHVLRHFR